jgi:hypothetical protein
MLSALERRFGRKQCEEIIGVCPDTWTDWTVERKDVNNTARKAVWLIWSLALHPEQVTSLWDIATYGRFHGQQMIEPEPDWEI